MTKAQAQALAHEWVEAFNNHDLERILSHYADTVELKSLLGACRGNDCHERTAELGQRCLP